MHCTKCRLHETRRTPVPGAGTANPKVLIIGEAPGAQEDAAGIPFVGRAGKYLDKWLAAIQLSRTEDVFIGNIIKCRPPQNRDPFPDEQAACLPYLRRQIALLKPFSILCLGRIAAQIITGRETSLGRMRGTLHAFEGIPVVVTYHPSAVLRNPGQFRRPVWEDLQRLKKLLDNYEVS
jgi:DNA polymerase